MVQTQKSTKSSNTESELNNRLALWNPYRTKGWVVQSPFRAPHISSKFLAKPWTTLKTSLKSSVGFPKTPSGSFPPSNPRRPSRVEEALRAPPGARGGRPGARPGAQTAARGVRYGPTPEETAKIRRKLGRVGGKPLKHIWPGQKARGVPGKWKLNPICTRSHRCLAKLTDQKDTCAKRAPKSVDQW